jgi:glycosyltransferase involved in cell wall biosynthesis
MCASKVTPVHQRHLVVVASNPIATGGMQRFSRFIIRSACQAGWKVTIALSGLNIYQNLAEDGHCEIRSVDWVDSTDKGDRNCTLGCIRDRYHWFRQHRADLALFIQSSNTPFRASVVGARLARIPVIVTHRTMCWLKDFCDVGMYLNGRIAGLGLHNRKMVLKTTTIARLADTLVFNSQAVRDDYIHTYSYPADRCVVIPNAVAPVTDQSVARKQRDTFVIGYAGRIAPEKQLDVLVDAIARSSQRQRIRLELFGTGESEPTLREQIAAHDLTDQVTWHGEKPSGQDMYRDIDCVVLCSRRESSSNMILEAMSAGKPVVVSDVGGLPELISFGRAGRIVPVADVDALARTIDQLAADPETCNALGLAGQQIASQTHHPDTVRRQWLTLFEKTADSPTGFLQSLRCLGATRALFKNPSAATVRGMIGDQTRLICDRVPSAATSGNT